MVVALLFEFIKNKNSHSIHLTCNTIKVLFYNYFRMRITILSCYYINPSVQITTN